MTVRQVHLHSDRYADEAEGPAPALYIMVMAHGDAAKIGALEAAMNAPQRLLQVERKQRARTPEPSGYPMRLAIVGELVGLNLGCYEWRDGCWVYEDRVGFDRRWAIVEHLESALRLALARRLGRLSSWPEWIEIDTPIKTDHEWEALFMDAWREVDGLGPQKMWGS
jgi:hypothetical protein